MDMPVPKRQASGEECTITMTELRAQPGEIFNFVEAGGIVHVTLQGRKIASITPHSDTFFEKFAAARPALLRGDEY